MAQIYAAEAGGHAGCRCCPGVFAGGVGMKLSQRIGTFPVSVFCLSWDFFCCFYFRMRGIVNEVSAGEVWFVLLGEHGAYMRMALQMLRMVPASAIVDALGKIETEVSVGPLVNPTAYLDGRKWRNADEYMRVLNAALTLRRTLPDPAE